MADTPDKDDPRSIWADYYDDLDEPGDTGADVEDAVRIETPAELVPHEPGGPALSTLSGYVPLDRERPERRQLIPTETLVLFLASAILVAGVLIGLNAAQRATLIEVPDLLGVDADIARTQLARQGLDLRVASERFSASPVGEILEQTPAPGTEVPRDSVVRVVVSAGTEEFTLPDVVGDGILLATGRLQGRGLQIITVEARSDEPSGTVIAMNPAPGALVRTGDVVRLTIASQQVSGTAEVVPYRFSGASFVIDPAPSAESDVDITLEVSRKLQSLLEASGATVAVTRSLTDTDTGDGARALRARDAGTPTAVIGLATFDDGRSRGLAVRRLATGQPTIVAGSTALAAQLAQELRQAGSVPAPSTVAQDPVLAALIAPGARVILGSPTDDVDASAFRDPMWADRVARSIYKALGERYATQ